MSLPAVSKYVSAVESANVIVGSTSQEMMGISNIESIFYILSESLYSDPRYSAITEILANAWDSHIVSGKTSEPVKLTIDEDNNTIIIEDSGNGIPHDKFMDLYGNLGGTSKAQDFTTTGGMGIGKLAPLALTDSFTVNNHHGGIQRTYAVVKGSIDSAGRHTIMLLNETPTDRTGLTVTYVDVNFSSKEYEDFVRWKLPRLDTHVHVKYGSTDAVYKPFIGTNNFAHFHKHTYGYHSNGKGYLSVLLGSCLFSTDDILELPGDIKTFLHCNDLNVVLKVPDGLILNFTPNRESLIDTEHNRTILNNLLTGYVEWFKSVKNTLTDNWFKECINDVGITSFTSPYLDNFTPSYEEVEGQLIPLETILTVGKFALSKLSKTYLDTCTQRSLFHNTRGIDRNNLYKCKKFRKAVAFMVTHNISGYNIKPRTSMTYEHSRKSFYRKHGELLLTVRRINLIPMSSPKYTEGYNELNLYLKKSVCRDTITKGLLKLNPNVTVTVKPSLAPVKTTAPVIRTQARTTRNSRKRFVSVYDYLESLKDSNYTPELTTGNDLFIASQHLVYLQLIMKAPKEFSDKLLQFVASDTQDNHIDWVKLFTDKEMLKNITFVSDSERERYYNRASSVQIPLNRLIKRFLLHAYPKDIKNICTLKLVGNAPVNNKTNNIYRYLKHNRPDIFTNHSSEMLEHFRQLSREVGGLFSYSESGHAYHYLGDSSIFQVLLKMSDTPYFTPTFNSLTKLGHIPPCQNLSQSLQPVHL